MFKYKKLEQDQTQLPYFVTFFSFPVIPGPILSLSTQCIRDCRQVKVLALSSGQQGGNHDGSLLMMFSLPAKDFAGTTQIEQINIYYFFFFILNKGHFGN